MKSKEIMKKIKDKRAEARAKMDAGYIKNTKISL